MAYILTINGGNFFDRVVSLKSTVDEAVKDGLKHYKKTSATPGIRPEIKAEPTNVVR